MLTFFIISPESFYLQLQDWKCVLPEKSISCSKMFWEQIRLFSFYLCGTLKLGSIPLSTKNAEKASRRVERTTTRWGTCIIRYTVWVKSRTGYELTKKMQEVTIKQNSSWKSITLNVLSDNGRVNTNSGYRCNTHIIPVLK